MDPCYDFCYLRYNKQYSQDCDSTCEYAKVVLENKALKEIMELDRVCPNCGIKIKLKE